MDDLGRFEDARVAAVLLKNVGMTFGDVTVEVEGVAVVVFAFTELRGRLDLYHLSASDCVLNFLSFAPENP